MTADLYGVLGVPRDAKPAAINSAYRRLAARHHPDKDGGDRAAFERIVRAKTVLLDAAKRASYDATGECDDAPDNHAASVLQAVIAAVQGVAMALVQQGRDPETEDLVRMARDQLKQQAAQVLQQMAQVPENAKKARALAARFTHVDGKPNRLGEAFENQARMFEQQAAGADRQVNVLVEAEELLAGYAFATKEKPTQPAASPLTRFFMWGDPNATSFGGLE